MNSENSIQSYRVALDTTQADLNDIREQINQLSALKERIEKAAEALNVMISLHEKAMPAPQAVAESSNPKGPEVVRPAAEPLFGSGFRPVPQFEAHPNAAPEFRAVAALA